MISQLKYSFDDEPVVAFFCDLGERRIVSYFSGYWDVASEQYVSKLCFFSIEKWSRIQCYIGPDGERKSFEQSMGIVSLFLLVKYDNVNDVLETSVLTVDGRFIELRIHNPKLGMDVLPYGKERLNRHDAPQL